MFKEERRPSLHNANVSLFGFKGHDDDIYMTGEHDGPAPETAEPLPGIIEHVSSNPEASPTDDLVSAAPNPSETPSTASEAKNVPSSPSHDQARNSSARGSTSKAAEEDTSDAPNAHVSSNATSRNNSLFESMSVSDALYLRRRVLLILKPLSNAVKKRLLTNLTLFMCRCQTDHRRSESRNPFRQHQQNRRFSSSRLKRLLR